MNLQTITAVQYKYNKYKYKYKSFIKYKNTRVKLFCD